MRDTNEVICIALSPKRTSSIFRAPNLQCMIVVQYIQNFLEFLVIVGCIVLVQLVIVIFGYLVLDLFSHTPETRSVLFQILDPVFRFSLTILISASVGAYLAHIIFERFLSEQILYCPVALFATTGAFMGFRLWRRFRVGGDAEV